MRAYIQYTKPAEPKPGANIDPAAVFKVADIPAPGAPPPGHVTLDVHAAALNPVDYKRAPYFDDATPNIAGYDAAGVVTAVAPDVTSLKVGDRVFGDVVAATLAPKPPYIGAVAESVHAPAALLAPIPAGVSFAHAAAVPLVATTALQVLREAGAARPGDRVFLGAGAGGFGAHAIQIAKAVFGAGEVATTASPGAKDALVRKLGADVVVNYREKDAGEELAGWADVAVDTMGDFDTVRKIKKPDGGRVTSIVDSSGDDIVKYLMQPSGKDMDTVASLMASGKLTAVIDSQFSLEDSDKAMERQMSGRAAGKIIINIRE